MGDSDAAETSGPGAWAADARRALGLLTRLPGARHDGGAAAHNRAVRAYPLAGLAVGAVGAAVFALAAGAGVPPLAAGLLAVAATALASGGLHEDGLADVADGLGGGRDRAAKLAIMKDSRTGSYGVLALVLSVGLRAAALAALAEPLADPLSGALALLAAHAGSRGLLPGLMWALPPARPEGLAGGLGKVSGRLALQALLLGAALALAFGGWTALAGLATALLLAAGLGAVARRQIGGYTGDVLGAAQQLAEIAFLLVFASLI
jgi:adenosylcobinamide-GDP ribazoletransferase